MELYVVKAEQQTGPFPEEQISSMLAAGMLEPTDMAWYEGLAEWTPLNQIFDLTPPAPEPEPVAPDPEPFPPESAAPEVAAAVPRPKPPAGILGVRPAQPVAQPVARPAQPRAGAQPAARGAVPVRAGAPAAAGRPVAVGAAPRAGVPVRAAVARGATGFAQPRFVHSGEPAPFGARLLAYIIDTVLMSLVVGLIVFLLSLMLGIALPQQGQKLSPEEAQGLVAGLLGFLLLVTIVPVIVLWLYYALMESSEKQGTFGKIWCGLIVADMDGGRIGFGRATGRLFGKFLSGFLFIGFLMCLWTEKQQCLHDIMAGCRVLKRGA